MDHRAPDGLGAVLLVREGMAVWFEASLWSSIAMVVLITIGYPILLAIIGPLMRRGRRLDAAEPAVTLIIAAHNEENCIARKLENALALDYPRERLEIIVASDGSTDATDAIVQSFSDRNVVLRSFPRTGKTGCQNAVVRTARGE